MSTNQEMCELPAGCTGLRQKLGYRELQQAVGEKKCGFQRQAAYQPIHAAPGSIASSKRFVIKPTQLLLEYVRNDLQQPF